MAPLQHAARGAILVVDDEEAIVRFIQDALEDDGYTVYIAVDGDQALDVARQRRPDLIILDIMLPQRDGIAICKELRKRLDIPILFLSARQSEVDKLRGFSAGGDDYIVKPFSIKELLARVEAHLRRQLGSQRQGGQAHHPHHPAPLRSGELVIDLAAYEARYACVALSLTRKEFEVLQLLALHPRQVFSREIIYERVWGMDALGATETVTEHIKRLRQKLAQCDPLTEYIGTVWGVGYKWTLNVTA